jgi:hypothetical protein
MPGDHNGLEIVFEEAKMPRSARDITFITIFTTTDDGEIVDYYKSERVQFSVVAAPFKA